jgi:hypothetical protein
MLCNVAEMELLRSATSGPSSSKAFVIISGNSRLVARSWRPACRRSTGAVAAGCESGEGPSPPGSHFILGNLAAPNWVDFWMGAAELDRARAHAYALAEMALDPEDDERRRIAEGILTGISELESADQPSS